MSEVIVPNKESKLSGPVVFTMGLCSSISPICEISSDDGLCCGKFFSVKREKRMPIVRTTAEKMDKRDKESLKDLSDKTPPPKAIY